MALKLVTAPPGTGKTLLLIRMIFEYLAEGRRVFSNISGLKIVEVLPISSTQDWRDLPDGSVVIYDEAHEHPAFSKDDIIDFPEFEEPQQLLNENITNYKDRISKLKKTYDKEKKRYRESIIDIARALKIHRHFGFDIILATQDSSDLNARTTNIVGEHYHLTRPFGFKGNTLFFWRRHVSSPDSTSERSKCEWKKHINFKKSYFDLYHSANVHTHKAKLPFKYIVVAFIAFLLCCLPFYLLYNNKSLQLLSGKKPTEQGDIVVNQPMPTDITTFNQASASSPVDQESQYSKDVRKRYEEMLAKQNEQQISGCIYFDGKYTAVDEFARPIHNKAHLCKDVIQNADRNAMKKPSQQTYNNYSPEASTALNQSAEEQNTTALVQAQREAFNEP